MILKIIAIVLLAGTCTGNLVCPSGQAIKCSKEIPPGGSCETEIAEDNLSITCYVTYEDGTHAGWDVSFCRITDSGEGGGGGDDCGQCGSGLCPPWCNPF
ncbi:MAG: hypothetical protein QNK37_07440 [Acidobacteriota bacterium]|nr:hypothetical protein [Acidobacteriota bacterium]